MNCWRVSVSSATRKAKFPVLFSCKAIHMLWCFRLLLSGLLDRSRYVPGRSCDRPAISTPGGFLGFPLSASKYSDGSQHSKLLLHASHNFFSIKVTELMFVSVMVTKFNFFLINYITSDHEIIMQSASSLIRHQMFELQSKEILT